MRYILLLTLLLSCATIKEDETATPQANSSTGTSTVTSNVVDSTTTAGSAVTPPVSYSSLYYFLIYVGILSAGLFIGWRKKWL